MSDSNLLEQYKLYVEMSDRIGIRRQYANTFFLTINTAILALIGYFKVRDSSLSELSTIILIVPIAGILLCYTWWRMIKSYKTLNDAKFMVILEMEKKLPFDPFEREWEILGRGEDSKKHRPFTGIESRVPWIFGFLHLIVLIAYVHLKIC
jgi:hypothetical protein